MLPDDRSVVRGIETESGEAVADALARVEQSAGMGDAREDGEVDLRNSEGLVDAVGLAPSGDFLASDEDYPGGATTEMNGASPADEGGGASWWTPQWAGPVAGLRGQGISCALAKLTASLNPFMPSTIDRLAVQSRTSKGNLCAIRQVVRE